MNASKSYTFNTASLEIILLLLGAFVAGALLCYVLKLTGLCCRRKQQHPPDNRVVHMPPRQPASPSTREALTSQGGYEADLHSLLRGRQTNEAPDASTRPLPQQVSSAPTASFQNRVAQATAASVAPVSKPTANSTAEPLDLPDEHHVDDLKKLEGIGPKIEALLNQHGIRSYAKLATMDRDDLKAILESGGSQFKMHEPKSWPYQAELAAKQNWARLKEYQEFLISGNR